jgi:hypothetical protein
VDPALRVDGPLEAGWIRIALLYAAAALASALQAAFPPTVLPIQFVQNAVGTHADSAAVGDGLLVARHPSIVMPLPVAVAVPLARATVAATPLREPPPLLALTATGKRAVFAVRVITLALEPAVALHALQVTGSPTRDSAAAMLAELVLPMP